MATEGSAGGRARSARGLDNVTGLGSSHEVTAALAGDGTSDAAIRGNIGEISLDDSPGCLGAIVAGNILGYRNTAGGSVDDALDNGDDVVDAEGADVGLQIIQELGDAKRLARGFGVREACNLANSGIDLLNAVLDGTRFSRIYSDAAKIALASGSDVLSSLGKCGVTAWGGSADTFEPGVNGLDDGGVGGSREDINCVENAQAC